jgi:Short C-terminal domain
MQQLSPTGQQTVHDLAQRHGFSTDGICAMLDAVQQGQGSMAQFNHPDFSGSGQWMRGGMTMVSDMFNQQLKYRVDTLCAELSNLVQNGSQHLFVAPASGQPGTGGASGTQGDWWPADLRWPNSTGAQNGVRYACFGQAQRLVVDVDGVISVYDTLDHHIGGVSQQQGSNGSLSFTSQYGQVDLSRLPLISTNGRMTPAPAQAVAPSYAPDPAPASTWSTPAAPAMSTANAGGSDVFTAIERLAELHARGILNDLEFSAKKAELLSRL